MAKFLHSRPCAPQRPNTLRLGYTPSHVEGHTHTVIKPQHCQRATCPISRPHAQTYSSHIMSSGQMFIQCVRVLPPAGHMPCEQAMKTSSRPCKPQVGHVCNPQSISFGHACTILCKIRPCMHYTVQNSAMHYTSGPFIMLRNHASASRLQIAPEGHSSHQSTICLATSPTSR